MIKTDHQSLAAPAPQPEAQTRIPGAAPPLDVQIFITDERWHTRPEAEALSKRAALAAWTSCWPKGWPVCVPAQSQANFASQNFELSIELCDNARIRQLNRKFRGRDRPTNVLSFPSGELASPMAARPVDVPVYLGDVALAIQTLEQEAQHKHIPVANHMAHLVIHAMLHLMGWDHENEADAQIMEALEIEILQALNISNPYQAS